MSTRYYCDKCGMYAVSRVTLSKIGERWPEGEESYLDRDLCAQHADAIRNSFPVKEVSHEDNPGAVSG